MGNKKKEMGSGKYRKGLGMSKRGVGLKPAAPTKTLAQHDLSQQVWEGKDAITSIKEGVGAQPAIHIP